MKFIKNLIALVLKQRQELIAAGKCPQCHGRGSGSFLGLGSYVICPQCKGSGRN